MTRRTVRRIVVQSFPVRKTLTNLRRSSFIFLTLLVDRQRKQFVTLSKRLLVLHHYTLLNSKKWTMLLLPLQLLFKVPVNTLALVSDNAKSPAQPLSAKPKRRPLPPERSISWDGIRTSQNRWSDAINVESMVPKNPRERRLHTTEQHPTVLHQRREGQRRTGARNAPARTQSMDSTFETLSRGHKPARRPRRKLSPEPNQQGELSPVTEIRKSDSFDTEPKYSINSMIKTNLTLNAFSPTRTISPPPRFLDAHEKISTSTMLTNVLEEFHQSV